MARQRVCRGSPRPRGAIGVFHKVFASYFNLTFHISPEMFTEVTYRNEQSTARSGRSGSHGPSTTRQASVPVSPEKWRAHVETRLQTQNFSFTEIYAVLQHKTISTNARFTVYLCTFCSIDLQSSFSFGLEFWQCHCVTDRLTSGISTLMALRCRSAFPKPSWTSWVRCQVRRKTIHNSNCLIIFLYVYVCFCRVFEHFETWRKKWWDRDLIAWFFML